MTLLNTSPAWRALDPAASAGIKDSKAQLHYAAQFATALGISYLPPKSDDSHTNLGWDAGHDALKSREIQSPAHTIEVAIRPADLTLLVLLDGSIAHTIPLHGSTIRETESALRSALSGAGLDGKRLTLKRHYEIPSHPVASGERFDASRHDEFEQLAAWYANASIVLEALRSRIKGAEVRCWPHHFDIATLATVAPGRSSGAGMLPGDGMYPEPYYYVNASPAPRVQPDESLLAGGGVWNSDEWFGAVLTGSRLTPDQAAQPEQVRVFLDSAFDACASLLRS